jgi:L-amino acid N-acyltransferase YncA
MRTIRLAKQSDAPALLSIYGQYIDTSVTFEYELPSPDEFARRIRETSARYPYLVCEEDGVITGYAYAAAYRERAAYIFDAETSIYLDSRCRGRGNGRALYTALIGILRLQNIVNVYAVIIAGNESSERMHEALGYRLLFRHEAVGYKHGQWLDALLYELRIGERSPNPAPFIPIGQFNPTQIHQMLSTSNP